PSLSPSKICSLCGRELKGGASEARGGAFVCATCRADPEMIVRLLLREADAGHDEVRALRGYALEEELGRGGMGAVFLIRHTSTGDRAALKIMLPQVGVLDQARAMFLRETENTRALQHRH